MIIGEDRGCAGFRYGIGFENVVVLNPHENLETIFC